MNDGGPAFPSKVKKIISNPLEPGEEVYFEDSFGMTLCDYFAASEPTSFIEFIQVLARITPGETMFSPEQLMELYAKFKFEYADAMLKAREGGK